MAKSAFCFSPFTFVVTVVATALSGGAACAATIGVEAVDASAATLCAETDNVYVKLLGEGVQQFRIEARHPSYIGAIVADNTDADHSNCDRSSEQFYEFDTRRVTLYESREIWLIGYVFERYWRRHNVPVRVGRRTEHGLHMIQLWIQASRGPEEFLVLYPPDGHWRARPLTPAHLQSTSYGSSFLVGPVVEEERPVVEIAEVRFNPANRAFYLAFRSGGRARIQVVELDDTHTVLEVFFDRAMRPSVPFLALRSMYVTPGNADVAEVAWREGDSRSWTLAPITSFKRISDVVEIWLGRSTISRHNTSAPDMIFGSFASAPGE